MSMTAGSLSDPLYLLPLLSLAWFLIGVAAGRRLVAAPRRAGMSAPRRASRDNGGSAGGGRGDEIYVGNLSYDVTEKDLQKMLAEYGAVASVRLINNKFNGKSKGYAFVRMTDEPANERVIKALSGKDHKGRKLVVNMAKSKAR